MYCSTCGTRLQDDANYCSSCGAGTRNGSNGPYPGQEPAQPTRPVITLRPTFVPSISMLSVFPLQVLLTLWGALFFGGLVMFCLEMVSLDVPKLVPFIIAGAVFFFGIPVLAYFTKQKIYAKSEYRFYTDKLDYFDGFFTTEEKSVDYSNITEINLRRGVFQKLYGLGTIVLSTPATGMIAARERSRIMIADIPNADRVYQQVKGLLERF